MTKFWLLVIAVIVIFLVMRLARNRRVKRQASETTGKAAAPEEMVPCEVCGIHLPRSEAHNGGHAYFCSEEHLHCGIGKRQP